MKDDAYNKLIAWCVTFVLLYAMAQTDRGRRLITYALYLILAVLLVRNGGRLADLLRPLIPTTGATRADQPF